jgi:polyisoprenoid-binding protein YceI
MISPAARIPALGFVLAAAIAPALAAQAAPPTFRIDPAHTQVMFRVRHLGVAWVTGKFREFTGSFVLDSVDLARSSATMTIRTASVDTENERRDNDLRSPNFFAADSFPEITFRSTSVERGTEPGTYRMHGELTIRRATRPITLDVEQIGVRTMSGRDGPVALAGFVLTGRINRFDYGLTWNRLIEGVNVVGEEVRITVEVEARAALGGGR